MKNLIMGFLILFVAIGILAGCGSGGGGGLVPGGNAATSLGPNTRLVLSFPWPGGSGKIEPSRSVWIFAGKLEVRIQGDGLPAPVSASATQKDVVNGQVTLSFDNIPPGKKEVSVAVFNPDGFLIAHRTQTISVAGDTALVLTVGITLFDGTLAPQIFPMAIGDSVLWTNSGALTHRLVGDKGEFDSQDLLPNQSYSFTPAITEDIPYHCTLHSGETGALHVTDPNLVSTTTTTGGGGVSPSGPHILGINPTSGIEGTPVIITGSGFGVGQGSSTVSFQASNAPPVLASGGVSWQDTQIQVNVPPGLPSGGVSIFVTVGGIPSNNVLFSISGGSGPPQIMAVNPPSGNFATELVVQGSGFGTTQGTVRFNGNPAMGPAPIWTDTEIHITPPLQAGSGLLTVEVSTSGGVLSNSANFQYLAEYNLPGPNTPLISGLQNPWAVALDFDGAIYVSFTSPENKASKYTTTGALDTTWGSLGSISTSPVECWGLVVDSARDTFLTQGAPQAEVKKYNITGTSLLASGSLYQPSLPENESAAFGKGIALDGAGNPWVCDSDNNAIERYSLSGGVFNLVNRFTPFTAGGPYGVAADNRPNFSYIYVTDTGANAVRKFVSSNSPTDMGAIISGANAPTAPKGIAVARSGHIFVTDTGANTIRIYDLSGTWIKDIGLIGYLSAFSSIGGLAVDKVGNIYVADAVSAGAVWKLVPSATSMVPMGRVRQR
ncbi:MAG: IPT/TIG domain-containing protein [Armatimonadetes bacterium]|nr:IPT/TIG domain-containing protein [Armatimonadota bacterium]